MSGLAEAEVDISPLALWGRRVGLFVVVVLVLLGIYLLARQLMRPVPHNAKQTAKITIVPDTPPPPPPPPKEEKKPEPPKESPKEVKLEQPKQEQQPKPQESEQIKMEGPGSDNGIAGVAAGAVEKDYAGQKIGGDGSGGGADRFGYFRGTVQAHIQRALQRDVRLKGKEYRVVVRFWFNHDGSLRAELADSTGDDSLDGQLRAALTALPPLAEAPPEGLPQPARVRLTSRS